jgi:UDP-N-acetylglucosamine 2-epimerase (non-hydrolysing)
MRISIVLGTRPEIIKMSPVIRELERQGRSYFILHTGQHYTRDMDAVFLEGLKLPQPKYNLGVGSGTHAEETGKMLIGVEEVLRKEGADVVLVEGDTNTVLAGALAAAKLHIRVGHIEAGLRSFDRRTPSSSVRKISRMRHFVVSSAGARLGLRLGPWQIPVILRSIEPSSMPPERTCGKGGIRRLLAGADHCRYFLTPFNADDHHRRTESSGGPDAENLNSVTQRPNVHRYTWRNLPKQKGSVARSPFSGAN